MIIAGYHLIASATEPRISQANQRDIPAVRRAVRRPWRAVSVHGGELPEDLIIIEFPDLEIASRWYDSPAYRAIKPLRTANSIGTVFLVQGVPSDHRATDILAQAVRQ